MTATAIAISGDPIVAGYDNVFINNKLYWLLGSSLSVVDLITDTATTATVTGPSGWLDNGPDFGAGWTNQANELFFSNNGSGSIHKLSNYNSPTPTASFIIAATATNNNDGASCALAQSPFDPPVAANDNFVNQI